MSRDALIAGLESVLRDRIVALETRSRRRTSVQVVPEDVVDAARVVFETFGGRLQTITGMDTSTALELLYHWALDGAGCVITVRTRLARDKPVIASIAPLCPAAEWIEREIRELLGVEFRGHPDPRHLLLAEDWPEGKHPLRRDYEG